MPICLAEIDRCRPYFIGMLGERYGFIPRQIDPELIRTQPWLEKHREKSLTELEVLHGVLNNPKMVGRAFFYFRDPAYVERLPAKQQRDFLCEDDTSREKLLSLKNQIRENNVLLKEAYANPEALGELILEDLWQAIDQEFPKGREPDLLDREAEEHTAFAESRAKVYIGREEYFRRLDAHIEGEDPPLVIVGESGSGKSALLSNWALRYQQAHPHTLLIQHYIGATPYSADWVAILRRILGEFNRRFDLQQDIADKPEELQQAFANALHRAAAQATQPIVILLDGLNQLEDKNQSPDLVWLPPVIPDKVRLVLSTLPGRARDNLKQRGWPTYEVKPLEAEERKTFIKDYLELYTKTLNPVRTARIVKAQQTTNPLYLKALLEELRLFGKHEELDHYIDSYLHAETIDNLFEKILKRYEQDYEHDRPKLVMDAMSYIWAARRGLNETDLLEMLGRPEAIGKKGFWSMWFRSDEKVDSVSTRMPSVHWVPLHLAAKESLVNRSGLLNFANDYFRRAVADRYLNTEEAKKAAHIKMADYFELHQLNDRKVDELPWQLAKAQAWQRLKDCIAEPGMFLELSNEKKKYELTAYWLTIGTRFEMAQIYQDTITKFEVGKPATQLVSHLLNQVASFLVLNSRYEGAESHYRRALTILEQSLGSEHPNVASVLSGLAELLRETNRLSEAEPLLQRALAIDEQSLGREHPEVV